MKAEIAQEIANFKGHFLWKREKAKQIAAQVLNDPAATENEKALRIDEERTPNWFDNEMKEAVADWMRGWVKAMIATKDTPYLLGGHWIVPKGIEVKVGPFTVVTYNFGTVAENYGTVTYNYGTVTKNSGTVTYNFGTVTKK